MVRWRERGSNRPNHQFTMHWTALAILAFLTIAEIYGAATDDMPPNITEIWAQMTNRNGEALEKPEQYVQLGSNSELKDATNNLRCKASNAETIKWQYKQTEAAEWTDTLPSIMEAGDIQKSNQDRDLQLEIHDGTIFRPEVIKQIEGFYRCSATNKGVYETLSATVRVIVPIFTGDTLYLNDATTGRQNYPYKIPCFRDSDANGRVVVDPDVAEVQKYDPTIVKTQWVKVSDGTEEPLNMDGGRIKKDPITGDLYYAYLLPTDALETNDITRETLKCKASVGLISGKVVNDFGFLTVSSNTDPIAEYTVEYPQTEKITDGEHRAEKQVVCREGMLCRVTCIFGGSQGKSGKVLGIHPVNEQYTVSVNEDNTGFSFLTPENADPKIWKCELWDTAANAKIASIAIEIKTENYPKLRDRSEFPPVRYAATGSSVDFICNAIHVEAGGTKYLINGQEVRRGSPDYVTYNPLDETKMTIASVQRSHSNSILCISRNDAGDLYTTSDLIVYDSAQLTQYPTKDNPYVLDSNLNNTAADGLYGFNCSIKLDEKVDWAEIYWMSNTTRNSKPVVKKITKKEPDDGVSAAYIPTFVPHSGILTSQITLLYDTESDSFLRDSKWWCVVKFRVLGGEVAESPLNSEPVLFKVQDPPSKKPVVQAFGYYPVIFGAIGGFIFLILLIVLINCYVQKNKGEQYYVEDKERKAGHNPEDDTEAYGFSEYTRPDQNPIKGSRASMNFSDKPMESDTGSLDEYGDIDPGRYNEDGSFINGQYGQNGPPPRNQADV